MAIKDWTNPDVKVPTITLLSPVYNAVEAEKI